MSDVLIIGVVIFALASAIGKTLYYAGEALMESDFPFSFPEVVDLMLYLFGAVFKGIGFISYKLAVAFGCVYILKELL